MKSTIWGIGVTGITNQARMRLQGHDPYNMPCCLPEAEDGTMTRAQGQGIVCLRWLLTIWQKSFGGVVKVQFNLTPVDDTFLSAEETEGEV